MFKKETGDLVETYWNPSQSQAEITVHLLQKKCAMGFVNISTVALATQVCVEKILLINEDSVFLAFIVLSDWKCGHLDKYISSAPLPLALAVFDFDSSLE